MPPERPPERPREPRLPSRRVEADLRERVARDEWSPGDRLPPVAELAAHYGVARSTVINALRRLQDDGLIEIVANWGTFKRLALALVRQKLKVRDASQRQVLV